MTSSTLAVPLGVQVPRVRLVPRAVSSEADDAVFLSTSYGLRPDEWQESVLDGWLGLRSDGRWAASKCGLAVPRQNGKNGVLEIRELYGMTMRAERFLHTAHEVKTARKAFARLLSFFDNPRQYPELAGLVREIRRTNGQEAIVLTNGGSVEFVARSKGSGRGFSVDVLVMDEAQELGEDALAALMPTISVSPNPQQIYTGTPPGPNADGEIFTQLRSAGVGGTDFRLAWHEWSCDEKNLDLDDRANWAKANPTLGIRLHADTISDERSIMSDETFARERLGVWSSVGASAVIDLDVWANLADPSSAIVGPMAFAIDVPPDRTAAAIAVSGLRADGLRHLEVIDYRRGTGWVAERILELRDKWKPTSIALDSSSPAGALIAGLQSAGIELTLTGARDMAAACGGLFDDAAESKLRHLGQDILDDALRGAKKRPLGDAWAFDRKLSTDDICPLVAATLARYAFTIAAPEKRKPIFVY